MNKLILLFDYIYYRIYMFFQERGDNIPVTTATLLLSLMQCLTVIDVMVVVMIIHDYPFPNKFAFLPLLAVVGAINWYRYERNFDEEGIKTRWREEDIKKRMVKGWFIGLYLLISFLIPAVYGYLKHNLKAI